jgi:hypothetical protein
MLEKGVVPVVLDFHDHAIHMDEHNKYRLSHEYEKMSQENPEMAMQFDTHIKIHEQALSQKMQQEMMSQMPIQA